MPSTPLHEHKAVGFSRTRDLYHTLSFLTPSKTLCYTLTSIRVSSGMRVIAGTHRGRRLHSPEGLTLRPTSDRVREALFSILGDRLQNCQFLDLYAGTGAVGIEAVSRGAQRVTCVESDTQAGKLLQLNVSQCGLHDHVTLCMQSVERFLSKPDRWNGPYDIIFADPPYTIVQEFVALLAQTSLPLLFAQDSWLIIEHATKTTLPMSVGSTTFRRRYRYGDTSISTYVFSTPTPL